MATILVTRPQPEGQHLTAALLARGWRVCFQPLLTFSAGPQLHELPGLLADLSAADTVIAVSPRALHYAQQILTRHQRSWPVGPAYLAIGQKTASYWQDDDLDVQIADPATSEGVLTLPATYQARQVLLLRGQAGRELITKVLQQRHIPCKPVACYQRNEIAWSGAAAITEWRAQQLSHIQVSSSEQLDLLLAKVPDKFVDWLQQRILIVPGERVANYASQRGFSAIIVAAGASNKAILDALP